MNKKKLIVPLILLLAAAFYFVFFHKEKTLNLVPKDADVVVLIDVKKLTRQYLSNLIAHPSKWSGSKTKDKKEISLKDSGIKIPDFLQIFHLKDTRFSEWYSVVELKDPQKFSAFLKSRQFISKGKNLFRKDQLFIKIEGENGIIGTSALAFDPINKVLIQSSEKNTLNADQLISHSTGSISFISGQKIQNFSIELKADEIEIKNTADTGILASVIDEVQKRNHFLAIELDARNVKNYAKFLDKNLIDSAQINYFKATADLEQVNDTIISYGYDDNFNEIEKKTVQKIIQPNYIIDLQSQIPEKAWAYFQHKKWINAQNQFTAIPFQPNRIDKSNKGLVIQSTRKPISLSPELTENYIFIKNNPLLLSSLKSLTPAERTILSDIEFIFYWNKAEHYWVKIKAKKGKLPLILRW
ncbi:hypothetical protein EG346_05720 [Chryseobacterium carnipullorum]|uniref:Uncharacterized protein n=1 Tax=Chryseobacterium carnipullorum TaxID=1124835 RepID=A0A376EMF8_CHRCU|nr:hypothetical protein [Chryseobacterium carnipullorum]AZA47718.1 hypothetical protein EG346_05720 [Chryseobacterium carnipullorum]AZA67042.1 hypothetical protein EG345_21865 [Chryseobacterium carnipullorum]STD11492.1 Uncharacterised protein [Chryseobacterium carnipullorum]